MEDLSFKPLSEGLGFYEKKPNFNSTNNSTIDAQRTSSFLSVALPDDLFPPELDFNNSQSYEHLLFQLEKPWLGENVKDSNIKKDSVLPTSTYSSGSVVKRETLKSTVKEPITPISCKENKKSTSHFLFEKTFYFSLKSYIVDFFISGFLFFPSLFLFVFLIQTDPLVVLWSVWPKILIGFLFFTQIYCFLCRLFCFETCGEALAKMRLYTLRSKKEVHPFLLFWRFLISCSTGVVLLPLLSLIFKKDYLARLTGLYFQKT